MITRDSIIETCVMDWVPGDGHIVQYVNRSLVARHVPRLNCLEERDVQRPLKPFPPGRRLARLAAMTENHALQASSEGPRVVWRSPMPRNLSARIK